jgi:hypothetical protein
MEDAERGDCMARVSEHDNKHRAEREVKSLSTQSVKVK